MLLTSVGQYWRPVETCSLEDFSPQPPIPPWERHPVVTSEARTDCKRALRIPLKCFLVSLFFKYLWLIIKILLRKKKRDSFKRHCDVRASISSPTFVRRYIWHQTPDLWQRIHSLLFIFGFLNKTSKIPMNVSLPVYIPIFKSFQRHSVRFFFLFKSICSFWRKGNAFTPVCDFVHRGVSGRHSPRQTPPWADTPPVQTSPLGRHSHPPRQTPPSGRQPPWADTPSPRETATAADGTHPTGMHLVCLSALSVHL